MNHTARIIGRSGFTLIEMLLATAMVAMLAASLYASLHIAFAARDTALSVVEEARESELVFDTLRADLLAAMEPNGTLANSFTASGNASLVNAQAGDLVFYAAGADGPPVAGIGDVRRVEYSCGLAFDGSGQVLMRQVTTNLLAPQVPLPRVDALARNVRSFTVRCFDGQSWLDSYDSNSANSMLPVAVEATVEFAAPNGGATRRATQVFVLPSGQAVDANSAAGVKL